MVALFLSYLLLIVLFITSVSPGWCAVSVDAAAASAAPSITNTKTISLTVNAASKLVLIGTGVSSQNRTVSSVTFSAASGCASGNGTAAFVGSIAQADISNKLELWKCVTPPTGSQTITVVWSDSDQTVGAGAISFLGTDGAITFNACGGSACTQTGLDDFTATVTTASGNMAADFVVLGFAGLCSTTSATPGGSQTVNNGFPICTDATIRLSGSTYPSTTTSDVMSWTLSFTFYAWIGADVIATSSVPPRRIIVW